AWSWALVAWPSSPLLPAVPVPATREITPAAETFRTTLFVVSAIRAAPSAVAVTPRGLLSWALVAGPSSPLLPAVPVPATREITPAADTFRTTLLLLSAIRNPPSAVTATPPGALSWASVAGPPSPLLPAVPVPATRVITPAADTFRTTLFSWSAIRNPPSAVTATPAGTWSWASVAGPSSPLLPAVPVPAPRVIPPAADTFRTTLFWKSTIRNPPSAVTATPTGTWSWALVAGPSSPLLPAVPVPATREIMPIALPFTMSTARSRHHIRHVRTR